MFDRLTHPLHYAEDLLARFTALAGSRGSRQLQERLVEAASSLTGCPLGQLFLLDATHTQLTLAAEWLDGQPHSREADTVSSDYNDQQLLQYCLCQNQVLYLAQLDNSLYATPFLPATNADWRSLLCLPLHDDQQHVAGLLLLASHEALELHGYADSLQLLGNFALHQLHLLQQVQQGQSSTTEVREPAPNYPRGYGLIGDSPAMQAVYQLIGKVLHNPVTVLLTGETGTGKELVARAIHDYGSRRTQPFIAQNCAALPENLLESELFGYRKGAFTGADKDHRGLIDSADGGTLFLDEIGDMPLALQAKLLRVLQEGEVRPLGSSDTHMVDVRIIAATHQDLQAQVRDGQFREDLYYRLTHFPIELPPLRERGEDIRILAMHFADEACCFLQREICRWSDSALEHLAGYSFPGNVRELKGLIARALLLCDGNLLLPEHFNLPETISQPNGLSLRERMERVERNLLLDCLQRNQGNQTSAASELGLPRRTLLYRMQRLNISPADLKSRERNHVQSGQ
ncbi:sigma-54 interaction domain-containing protein [Halopseudomonas phragmitis]|uniref:Sigma-54-dependent Fis family transcriptional regulator n=2 Tax=Pseudomonadaceae TaxID=135621 RepID=A0A1V0BAI1_9GAMM|nr:MULTISPECIES: sigma 54-interacting transcriptional regulator [Pseudomonadaceae]AQZ96804.1 sigma-54-dependent Fis family transcriptional regulator [Halopseudomonas phragmitis]RHW22708.1 sigma-54-dependent Fis family transcriptional regulator [Pseudomonas jilinensis]